MADKTVNRGALPIGAEILDTINKAVDYAHYLGERDGVADGDPAISFGTDTTTKVRMGGRVGIRIGGNRYSFKALEAVLSGAGDDITQTKFGAWRIELSALGVLTTTHAVAAGDMAFDSIEDALLNLASQARTALTKDVGYLAIEAASGGFTIGTDLPKTADAQVTAATYYDVVAPHGDNGLTAAMGASIAIGSSDTAYSTGTINVRTNGAKVTEIAAITDQAFSDADTMANTKYGAHLIMTDLAKTDLYSLASDGVAGSASAMTHATSAAAHTALDALAELVPLLFTIVGRIVVLAAKAFTYNTDDIAGTDGTAVYTDALFGDFNRDKTSLDRDYQAEAPTLGKVLDS